MMNKDTPENWKVIEVGAGYIVKSKDTNYEIFMRYRTHAYLFAAASTLYMSLDEILSAFSDPKIPTENLLVATKNAKAALKLATGDGEARP